MHQLCFYFRYCRILILGFGLLLAVPTLHAQLADSRCSGTEDTSYPFAASKKPNATNAEADASSLGHNQYGAPYCTLCPLYLSQSDSKRRCYQSDVV